MKIMVGYDGTDVSKRCLELAMTHAKAFDGKVFIVTALTQSTDLELKDIEMAERLLRDAELLCTEQKIESEKHLLVNDLEPGESLVHFTKDNKIDEIIVGVRRTSKVGKFLFGSTAQYVILEAQCPVATVK
jgi:nucleotide-binding universal stress UspA family protein